MKKKKRPIEDWEKLEEDKLKPEHRKEHKNAKRK